MESTTGTTALERFQLELEFVQCLANPLYVSWLANKKHFEQPGFVEYLAYLQYWKRPEYAKFVTYPHCLQLLDLLQQPAFRTAIADATYAERIRQQQDAVFKHVLSNRISDAAADQQAQQVGQQQQAQTAT